MNRRLALAAASLLIATTVAGQVQVELPPLTITGSNSPDGSITSASSPTRSAPRPRAC